ncbi:MAG: ATP-binding protein [Spirochaetaceae bacterium]
MRRAVRAGSSRSTLLGVGLLYLLLIVLVLLISRQVFRDVSFVGSPPRSLLFIPAGFIPLFLLAMVAANVVRVLRERAAGRPGSRFKLRLLAFFSLVIVLALVPQAVLSINVINASMEALFETRTGAALRDGLDLTLRFHDERVDRLSRFVDGEVFEELVAEVEEDPAAAWEGIRAAYPAADGFQVFGPDFEERFSVGATDTHISGEQAREAGDGFVARESTGTRSFLRVRRSVEMDGERYAVVLADSLPAGFEDTARNLTEAIASYTRLEQFGGDVRRVYAGVYVFFALPLLLLAVLAAFYLADEITRPIVNLEQAIARVAEGDYSFRVLSRTRDDLSILARSFNDMVAELERSRSKLIQTEKVAAWQEIAQRMAHEIKNPLTPIQLSAERMLRKYHSGAEDFDRVFDSSVRSIIREVEELNRLLAEFRTFSRLPRPHLESVALRGVAEEAAEIYAGHAATNIDLEGLPPELRVHADRAQIKQVFANLFANAVEAMAGEGDVRVRADLVKRGERYYARVQVRDTGPGIAEEYHGNVFNPYFTTKPDGTGLGLAIVERIIFDHGGRMWFETETGVGTSFFLDIPQDASDEHDFGSR